MARGTTKIGETTYYFEDGVLKGEWCSRSGNFLPTGR